MTEDDGGGLFCSARINQFRNNFDLAFDLIKFVCIESFSIKTANQRVIIDRDATRQTAGGARRRGEEKTLAGRTSLASA